MVRRAASPRAPSRLPSLVAMVLARRCRAGRALNTAIPAQRAAQPPADYASGDPARARRASFPGSTLAQVEPVKKDGKMVPSFSKEILALDRTDVKVQGFMIPLDIGDKQKRFLLVGGAAALPVLPARRARTKSSRSRRSRRSATRSTRSSSAASSRVLKDDATGILYRMTGASRVE